MPAKQRHSVISLGAVTSAGSVEIDTSSFDYAIVMVDNTSGSANSVAVEASPTPFGTTPVWYSVGSSVNVTTGDKFAWPIPGYGYSIQYVPSRIRIKPAGNANIWVELVREIG